MKLAQRDLAGSRVQDHQRVDDRHARLTVHIGSQRLIGGQCDCTVRGLQRYQRIRRRHGAVAVHIAQTIAAQRRNGIVQRFRRRYPGTETR